MRRTVKARMAERNMPSASEDPADDGAPRAEAGTGEIVDPAAGAGEGIESGRQYVVDGRTEAEPRSRSSLQARPAEDGRRKLAGRRGEARPACDTHRRGHAGFTGLPENRRGGRYGRVGNPGREVVHGLIASARGRVRPPAGRSGGGACRRGACRGGAWGCGARRGRAYGGLAGRRSCRCRRVSRTGCRPGADVNLGGRAVAVSPCEQKRADRPCDREVRASHNLL